MSKRHLEPTKIRFQTALTSTVRALSDVPDLKLQFVEYANSDFEVNAKEHYASISYPEMITSTDQITALRGKHDLLSYYLKYHDESIHQEITNEIPSVHHSLFNIAERIRIETLAMNALSGVASNIKHMIHKHYDELVLYDEEKVIEHAIAAVIRSHVSDHISHDMMKQMVDNYGLAITKPSEAKYAQLQPLLHDQTAFGNVIKNIILSLDLTVSDAATMGIENPAPEPDPQPDDSNLDSSLSGGAEDNEPSEEQQEQQKQTASLGGLSDDYQDTNNKDKDSDLQLQEYEYPYHRNSNNLDDHTPSYHVYTKQFDQIVNAESMCGYDELKQLRHQLDRKLSQIKDVTKRAASKLQMKLMAQQSRSWNFAQEEGILDNGQLANIVIDPNYPYLYKNEKPIDQIDTVVTLLIDNS
ncbi:MAG: hypothetical protein MK137_08040, partial [Rickettsiales bacterium]|nr:hypothetical protein [Rickettsiales bacterium]